ncbi:glycosyltransferase [Patescibacteria group bacterium]
MDSYKSMIRILYLTRAKLSLSRAHTQNIIKTAEYLNKGGDIDTVVFSSASDDKGDGDIFDSKTVTDKFLLDVSKNKRLLIPVLFKKRNSFDILYFRDPILWYLAFFARFFLHKKVVFEVHGSHEWWWAGPFWFFSARLANGLIFITQALKDFYNFKKPQIVVHCSGVDFSNFDFKQDKAVLRSELKLPNDKFLILYAGSLLWQSKEMMVNIAGLLPDNAILVLLGVTKQENFASDRIIIIPRVIPKKIPQFLLAADILINPLSIDFPGSISSKLYEYLASGKPIVSFGGNAIKEVLNDGENAILVNPMKAEDFVDAINKVISNEDLRVLLSNNARKSAENYTWEKRANTIYQFIKSL